MEDDAPEGPGGSVEQEAAPDHPYFQSIRIERYRAFESIALPELRRVNIIGGLNGSGKTTLLEAIFLLCNRADPSWLARAPRFRNIPFVYERELRENFFNHDLDSRIIMQSTSRNQKDQDATLQIYLCNRSDVQRVFSVSPQDNFTDDNSKIWRSNQGQKNVIVLTYESPINDYVSFTLEIQGQVSTQLIPSEKRGSIPPRAAILTPYTRNNHAENAEWFSQATLAGCKSRILSAVQIVYDSILELELLQISGTSIVHAKVGPTHLIPLPNVSDGASIMSLIASMIIRSKDGVVLMDEFDGAIHYNQLKAVWSSISDLATEFNCQLFIATHSMESIQAAVQAFGEKDRLADLCYIRLDRINGKVNPAIYQGQDDDGDQGLLSDAVECGWDIRS